MNRLEIPLKEVYSFMGYKDSEVDAETSRAVEFLLRESSVETRSMSIRRAKRPTTPVGRPLRSAMSAPVTCLTRMEPADIEH